MANWFETKVRYDKTMENGAIKKVTLPKQKPVFQKKYHILRQSFRFQL